MTRLTTSAILVGLTVSALTPSSLHAQDGVLDLVDWGPGVASMKLRAEFKVKKAAMGVRFFETLHPSNQVSFYLDGEGKRSMPGTYTLREHVVLLDGQVKEIDGAMTWKGKAYSPYSGTVIITIEDPTIFPPVYTMTFDVFWRPDSNTSGVRDVTVRTNGSKSFMPATSCTVQDTSFFWDAALFWRELDRSTLPPQPDPHPQCRELAGL